MIFVALSEAADKGELLLVTDGLCRFHRRRDGVFVIREIIVLPFRRRTGVGRRLVEDVLMRAGPDAVVRAKCPVAYESNRFWAAMGFRLVGEATGGINAWERKGVAPCSRAPALG